MLPEAGFFEAKMLGRIRLISQLPLASDSSLVTSCLQLVSEGGLSTVQHPKLHIVSDIVLTGHDFGSGGRADGVGKTISKAQTFCGKLV